MKRSIHRAAAEAVCLFLGRLFRSQSGTAAIEMTFVVPILAMMLFISCEMYVYMRTASAVQHAAYTIANSLGQMDRVIDTNGLDTSNTLGSIWSEGTLVTQPTDLTSNGGIVITSICDGTTKPCGSGPAVYSLAKGSPVVCWRRTAPWNHSSLTPLASAADLLPSTWPFRNSDSAIMVEVFYTYNPFTMSSHLWAGAPGTQTLYKRVYVRSRYSQKGNTGPLQLATSVSATTAGCST